MSLLLSKEQKTDVIASVRRFFSEKLDLELSEVQASFLLDYFSREIAPFAYNEGVEDAQMYLTRLAEDLCGTCFKNRSHTGINLAVHRRFAANRIIRSH